MLSSIPPGSLGNGCISGRMFLRLRKTRIRAGDDENCKQETEISNAHWRRYAVTACFKVPAPVYNVSACLSMCGYQALYVRFPDTHQERRAATCIASIGREGEAVLSFSQGGYRLSDFRSRRTNSR